MSVKVLILEDNPVARGFLCRVVSESFSDVSGIVEVSDLASARRELGIAAGGQAVPGDAPFQLILLDLELPDGSGLELLRQLGGYPATRIVTTLYSDDEHLFPALQCGADGYLLKEDRFEVLVEELQKIVRGQPPLSPAIARRLLNHFRSGEGLTGNGHGVAEPPASGAPSPAAAPAPLEHERLTPRESEVLSLVARGLRNSEVAEKLNLTPPTVAGYIKSVYAKLGISNRTEAARRAARLGLTEM